MEKLVITHAALQVQANPVGQEHRVVLEFLHFQVRLAIRLALVSQLDLGRRWTL